VTRSAACLFFFAPLLVSRAVAAEPTPEHWTPVARLIGSWSGTSSGFAGEGNLRDERVETFEQASPDQPYHVHGRIQLKRISR
jgi:hypothetical protein